MLATLTDDADTSIDESLTSTRPCQPVHVLQKHALLVLLGQRTQNVYMVPRKTRFRVKSVNLM